MPTYEYQCRDCRHSFDEYQPITAEPLVVCPNCGKHALKRVMGTGGGLIFNGSGFYQTDYKKNGSSPSSSTAKKEKTPEPKAAEAKSGSSETKTSPPGPKKD
jgi:putative FmdB family regulatory protein